jgi:hypothetical protein
MDLRVHGRQLKGPPKKDAVLLVENGMLIMQGLQMGMEKEWSNVESWLGSLNPADAMTTSINGAISDLLTQLETVDEFNPVITPVLDLTRIQQDAKQISTFMSASRLTPTFSTAQANIIATSSAQQEAAAAQGATGGVNFEQNIYAPTRLSTVDIYRQTRNQIALAKEELKIV